LGEVVGPIKTDEGYHLLLVSERTNCPHLDGDKTVLMQTRGDDIFGTVRAGTQFGTPPTIPQVVLDQLAFWSFIFVVGGICAELIGIVGIHNQDPVAVCTKCSEFYPLF
jgi:hypothetical protein